MKFMAIRFLAICTLAACTLSSQATDVLTYHNDVARTGLNSSEVILTPRNVASSNFGYVTNLPVDGNVYAQPLYAAKVPVNFLGGPFGLRNLVIVATENDSVYAFDGDTGWLYWQRSVVPAGETVADSPSSCSDLVPTNGITGTPVIERLVGGNGTIYLVAFTQAADASYHYRLHALDLSTGEILRSTEITASSAGADTAPNYSNAAGRVIFTPARERQRAALTLYNGVVYIPFAAFCDFEPYTGWLLAYYTSTFQQVAVLNTNPTGEPRPVNWVPGGSGGGIWMAGSGPAIGSDGHLYVGVGNGPFDTVLNSIGFPGNHDFGDSFLKLSVQLRVEDYFSPTTEASLANNDLDYNSGGSMVLDVPDSSGAIHPIAISTGKDGVLYVLNRNNLGKFNPAGNRILQQVNNDLVNSPGSFGAPAYFNGSFYIGQAGHAIEQRQFTSTAALDPVPASITSLVYPWPGAGPSISSSGNTNGILWAVQGTGQTTPAILHAYDATDLSKELYNSSNLYVGDYAKFTTPTIANGKVFVATKNTVAIFGLHRFPNTSAPDFNGDGNHDLLWRNSIDNSVSVWLMSGTNLVASNLLPYKPAGYKVVGYADLDGDGQSDILWANTATGAASVWFMNGANVRSFQSIASPGSGYQVAAAADFDGDGLADLVWRNPGTGALVFQRNLGLVNNQLTFTTRYSTTVSTYYQILGTGDFGSQGVQQLLWRSAAGDISAWFFNGFTPVGYYTYSRIDPNWQFGGIADFDGNGASDVLWFDSVTRAVNVWFMNGTHPPVAVFEGFAGQPWQLAGAANLTAGAGASILWTNPKGQISAWNVSGARPTYSTLGVQVSPVWSIQNP